MKRYWSALTVLDLESLSASENGKEKVAAAIAWDAKLTSEDILEMQRIDADCNDCFFFQRGAMTKIGGLTKFDGSCRKFNTPTTAWPMQYSGHFCFAHRKDHA